jgi:hypothetical protein
MPPPEPEPDPPASPAVPPDPLPEPELEDGWLVPLLDPLVPLLEAVCVPPEPLLVPLLDPAFAPPLDELGVAPATFDEPAPLDPAAPPVFELVVPPPPPVPVFHWELPGELGAELQPLESANPAKKAVRTVRCIAASTHRSRASTDEGNQQWHSSSFCPLVQPAS